MRGIPNVFVLLCPFASRVVILRAFCGQIPFRASTLLTQVIKFAAEFGFWRGGSLLFLTSIVPLYPNRG
jgi:hypothetical protein